MNVFVYGYGSIGKRHIYIMKQIFENINIYVIRHTSKEIKNNDNNYDRNCKENYIKKFFYNYEDALNYLIPDIAFICNPAPFHIDLAISLAKKNINLFIEKPISINTKKVQELINICSDNKLVLQIGYMTRYSKSLNLLRDIILEKKYGDILNFRCVHNSYLPSWRKSYDYSKDVTASEKLGGGVILELSHEIDYINWLFGDILYIFSRFEKSSQLKIDTEDNLDVIYKFKNNITGTLNINMASFYNKRECIVNCDKATLLWDGINFKLSIFTNENNELIDLEETRDDLFTRQIKDFFLKINKKNSCSKSAKNALNVLELIDKIKKSNKEKQIIW